MGTHGAYGACGAHGVCMYKTMFSYEPLGSRARRRLIRRPSGRPPRLPRAKKPYKTNEKPTFFQKNLVKPVCQSHFSKKHTKTSAFSTIFLLQAPPRGLAPGDPRVPGPWGPPWGPWGPPWVLGPWGRIRTSLSIRATCKYKLPQSEKTILKYTKR